MTTKTACTEHDFLKDISEHRMEILHDDGERRHLRFSRPNTRIYQFDLLTWPGFLCYTGDMGCFVFSRTRDMFDFFRTSAEGGLRINPKYWAEKCQAVDRTGGIETFSPDRAEKVINDYLDDFGTGEPLRIEVEEEVLSRIHDGEHEFRKAVDDFEHDGFRFTDFHEFNLNGFTYGYLWCCLAIVWGIAQYDKAKKEAA
jgi:hypothetical protein